MCYVKRILKGKYRLITDLGYCAGRRPRKTKILNARNITEANKQLVFFEVELKNNVNVHFGANSDITFHPF